MLPRPNNGTLRLPLKPVGIHEDHDKLDEPADPPSRPPGADASLPPSELRPERPAKPSSVAGEPTSGESESGEVTEDEGDSDGQSSSGNRIKVWWDWVKGKAGGFWDKITGHNKSD